MTFRAIGGDKATVDFYGDGLLEVEASDQLQQQIVKNTGTISADGGKIAMTAATGGQVVGSLINAQGVIKAQSVGVKNGEIVIGGGKNANSRVSVAGAIDASSVSGKGGKVTITADHIKLDATARIDASGATGGGDIKIGGDRHGVGVTPTAQTLEVAQGSFIKNDALINGDGGETVLWSDGFTGFAGLISGRGGEDGGDGGFVEVSGKDVLDFDGFVDLTASDGYDFGNLLLDPTDITISSAADSGGSFGSGTYTPSGASSVISATTLQSQITSANVTISTTSAHGGNGDITFANPVTFTTTSRTLTLNADRDIVFNAAAGWTSGTGGFSITAARDILFNANVSASGGGNINATAGRNLTVASGAVVKSGGTGGLSLRAAGGTISNTGVFTNSGTISAGTGTFTLLSGLDGSGNRGDLTLNSTNTLLQGANTAAITFTGFRDVTLSRNLTFNATSVITADRNLTVDTGVTLTASAGNLTLNAANAVNTGLGLLTLNGTINQGAGNLTLLSGVDGSSNRNDLTFTTSNLTFTGATMGTLTLSGYRDVTFNRSINSNGSMAVTAIRNLTIGTGVTVAATGTSMSLAAGPISSFLLRAGGATGVNIGTLNLNGKVTFGSSGTLTLGTGLDSMGQRGTDLALNTGNFAMQAATAGSLAISGFRDVTLDTDFISTGNISVVAERNLTIGNGVTIASGATSSTTLRAGGATGVQDGVFANNGMVRVGSLGTVLAAGANAVTQGNDFVWDTSHWETQSSDVGPITVSGFRDITIARDILSGDEIIIRALRNLTLGSGVTMTATTNNKKFFLHAANGDVNGTGILTLNGSVVAKGSQLELITGQDTAGWRPDFVFDNVQVSTTSGNFGGSRFRGFRDITFASNFISNAYVDVLGMRNVTVNGGVNMQTGPANSMIMFAAGGDWQNAGYLRLDGTFNLSSTLGTNFISGYDAGTLERPDLVFDASKFTYTTVNPNLSLITMLGFRDIALNQSVSSTSTASLIATRNLTIGAGVTLGGATGATLVAQNFINNSGSNAVSSSAGRWLIYSNDSTTSKMGGLAYDFRTFNCAYNNCANLPVSGSGFLFANGPAAEIVAAYRDTSLPNTVVRAPQAAAAAASMTTPATVSVAPGIEVPQSFIAASVGAAHNYAPADYILTFAPDIADRFGLQNWEF